MCSVSWVYFSLSKPPSECTWRLLYVSVYVHEIALWYFKNSLPLPLLLQRCKGNAELNSKEWRNGWHELKSDVSGCLFLWLIPCWCPEDGGFGAVQPGFGVSCGTQQWFCNPRLSPGCGALLAGAGWGGGAEAVKSSLIPSSCAFFVLLGLLKARNRELATVAERKPRARAYWLGTCCLCDRAICQSKPGSGYWPHGFLEVHAMKCRG